MNLKQLAICTGLMALLGGAAFVAREAEAPGGRMTAAADRFLASLDGPQKKKATFDFDNKERLRWFFTPQQTGRKYTRKGIPLEDMTDKQRELAMNLIRTGTSESGYKKVATVISLESILAELEAKKGAMVRDPLWYFVTIFGTPSKTGKWGWRIEGHHLSLNFTLEGGQVVSATPFFLGANPAEVKAGKHKGTIALPESITPYKELLAALDDDQRKAARQPDLFKEIDENIPQWKFVEPVGLSAAKLTEAQQKLLWRLIEGYAGRMPAEIAAFELAAIKKAGLDKVTFAFSEFPKKPGAPYKYRVQGPTFVIELINEQSDSAGNPANHIHSAWRRINGDFGLVTR
ncbi:MAG: DUF3500 domain-containing protein [Gemmataceae bacterium]